MLNDERSRRARDSISALARAGLDWVTFSVEAGEALRRAIPFDRSCWHMVDPGTVLFTGSLNQNVACSGSWLAEYEYVIEDVNQWAHLARSGCRAGATSLATHGDISRSARHRAHESYGIGDELRGSFVVDGTYWGAVGLLRDSDRPWYTEDDVRFLASLSAPIAEAYRRSLLTPSIATEEPGDAGPGVVVFDQHGAAESISPAAEHWIGRMVEVPRPSAPADSKMIQVVAARARALRAGQDPLELATRARVRTTSGHWLLLYGTRLSGGADGRTAVIIQPASAHEVAPLVALAYGLSERERQVTRLCMKGHSTNQIAQALSISPYTVQDHLKSIFEKTGARSRGELVGQIFLEHYVPRWEELPGAPAGWFAKATPVPEAMSSAATTDNPVGSRR